MRRMVLLVVLVFLMLPLHAQTATLPNPVALNLTLKDVGEGWFLKTNVTQATRAAALAAHTIDVAQGTATGFQRGSLITFKKARSENNSTAFSLGDLRSAVLQYDTTAHVQAAYLQSLRVVGKSPVLHPLTISAVGQQHQAWSALGSTLQKPAVLKGAVYVIYFYRSRYIVALIGSVADVKDTASILRLAHILDARIKAAH